MRFRLAYGFMAVMALCIIQGDCRSESKSQNISRKLVSQHNLLFGKRNVWRYAIPLKDRMAFRSYLSEVKAFIGKDNAQRAADFAYVEKTWKELLDAVVRIFHDVAKKNVDKVKWSELKAVNIPMEKINNAFRKVYVRLDEVKAIQQRAVDGKLDCFGTACKERFEILSMHALFLITAIEAVQASLVRLEEFVGGGSADATDKE